MSYSPRIPRSGQKFAMGKRSSAPKHGFGAQIPIKKSLKKKVTNSLEAFEVVCDKIEESYAIPIPDLTVTVNVPVEQLAIEQRIAKAYNDMMGPFVKMIFGDNWFVSIPSSKNSVLDTFRDPRIRELVDLVERAAGPDLSMGSLDRYKEVNRDRAHWESWMARLADFFGVKIDTPERLVLVPRFGDVGMAFHHQGKITDWLIIVSPPEVENTPFFAQLDILKGHYLSEETKMVFVLAHELWHQKQKLDGRMICVENGITYFEGRAYHYLDFAEHTKKPWEKEANEMALKAIKHFGLISEDTKYVSNPYFNLQPARG